MNDDLDECVNELRTIVVGGEKNLSGGTEDAARVLNRVTAELQDLDPS